MAALREAGAVPKWGIKETELQRRNVFLRQLNEVRACPPRRMYLGFGSVMCGCEKYKPYSLTTCSWAVIYPTVLTDEPVLWVRHCVICCM